jgi:peptidyl-dipeptidase Dcp
MSQTNNINISNNPFLTPYSTPFNAIPYDCITLEHFVPALKEAIRREQEAIEAICNNEVATFENTIVALDRSGLLSGEIIGAFNAMANAQSNDEILAIEEEIELLCTAHHNDISLNERLFARIKEVYNGDTSMLDTAQKRLLAQT